jgi:hypothetical protein
VTEVAVSKQVTPGLAWDWSAAALGAAYALPGAVLILSDVPRGLALALGVLPASIAGLIPRRRGRLAIVALGASIGLPMFVGGLLAGIPVLAVLAILGLGVASALLAARFALGLIVMTLCLPMVGVGLSYSDVGKAAGVAALMVGGSVFACGISMCWPERAARAARGAAAPPTLAYGLRLGAAGATAAAIGFALDLDHVGWACAAALMVMRPAAEMQRLRSVGRVVAVVIGALAAIGIVRLTPAAWAYSVAAIAAVAGVGAMRGSRWYVTPAFTTFLVFLLLLHSRPQDAASRFNQRVLETLLGVAIAYLFGLLLPAVVRRLRGPAPAPRNP